MASSLPTLPLTLKPNYVSIYGFSSIQGFQKEQPQWQFGLVNQIYDTLPNLVAVGDSVMFLLEDSIPFPYGGIQYYILPETKIVLVEDEVSEA